MNSLVYIKQFIKIILNCTNKEHFLYFLLLNAVTIKKSSINYNNRILIHSSIVRLLFCTVLHSNVLNNAIHAIIYMCLFVTHADV